MPSRSLATTASLLASLALAACNSSSVLDPSAAAPPQAAAAANTPATAAPPAAATTVPTAATPTTTATVAGKTRLQIAPIVGAPVEAAAPLTERLNQRARAHGIALAGSADQTATHVLKGYFSTMTEGAQTTVIYVWDVYDPAGNRLHRINGQMKAASAGGAEGWAAVPPATMQAIADSTVDQLSAWLAGRAG